MEKPTAIDDIPNRFLRMRVHNEDYQDDELLILRIGNSDVEALQVLYDRYWEILYQYALSKLPSIIAARCVIEGLFVHIWNNRNCLGPQKNAEAFLFEELKKKIIHFYSQTFFE